MAEPTLECSKEQEWSMSRIWNIRWRALSGPVVPFGGALAAAVIVMVEIKAVG